MAAKKDDVFGQFRRCHPLDRDKIEMRLRAGGSAKGVFLDGKSSLNIHHEIAGRAWADVIWSV
jgi:hypothetical protein